MMTFGFKHQLRGGHVHIDVFAGTNPDALGKAGTVIMRPDEWEKFKALVDGGRLVIGAALDSDVKFVELPTI